MRDSWQLALGLEGQPRSPEDEVMDAARVVVTRLGVDRAAEKLDVSVPYLRHALAERNRHDLKLVHAPTLIALDDDKLILKTLAKQANCLVEVLAPPDPAAELAALKDRMAAHLGPALRAVIIAEAQTAAAPKKGGKR